MDECFRSTVCFLVFLILTAFFAGCAGSSSNKPPLAPGLELSLTGGSPGDQGIAADASTVISHILLDAIGTDAVSISSVTLCASGSGDDLVDISSLEIYLDVDDDDAYNSGIDVLIGSGAFDADDGKAKIDLGPSVLVSPGTTRNLLVLFNLNGNGPNGATYSFGIPASGNVFVKYISGIPTSTSGLPLTSAVLTITSGGARLNLLAGPAPPPSKQVLRGRANVPVLQFTLYNRDSDLITVDSIRVTPSGTGNDATEISQAHIRVDTDGDGLYDTGEPLFADFTYSADDAAENVSGSYAITTGAKAHFLVLYDLGAAIVSGNDFQTGIAALGDIHGEDISMNPVTPTGTAPLQGALITALEKGALSVQIGSGNPAAASYLAGSASVPVLQLELQAEDIEDVLLDTFSLYATGIADDAADIALVRLYDDANGDGAAGTGDTALVSGQYAADDGVVTFSSVGFVVPSGETANLLVTYDLAATAQTGLTFGAYVLDSSGIGTSGVDSALGIDPAGTFPLNSALFTIREPDTFMVAANLNTARFMHTQTTFTDPADGRVKVLVCGGHDGANTLDSAEIYDETLDMWTELPVPMTKPRMLHTATLLADGQRILIAGGTDGSMLTYQDGEIFDPATYTFTPVTDLMTSRRQMHTAVLTNGGDVFYFGGQYIFGGLMFVETTEYYSDYTQRFDPLGTSPYVRILHTMNILSGGTVIVTGGLGHARQGPKAVALLKSIQIWATSPTFYESPSWLALAGFGRCGHVGVSLPGGNLLIAGGYSLNLYLYTHPPFMGRKIAELVKENTSAVGDETIQDVGEMSEVRFMPVAQLLPNGKVLIAGGTDDSMTASALDTAELYNPSTATFSDSTGIMVQPRYRATWSLLAGPDGQLGTSDDFVLIAGGLIEYAPSPGPAQITRFAEIYMP